MSSAISSATQQDRLFSTKPASNDVNITSSSSTTESVSAACSKIHARTIASSKISTIGKNSVMGAATKAKNLKKKQPSIPGHHKMELVRGAPQLSSRIDDGQETEEPINLI